MTQAALFDVRNPEPVPDGALSSPSGIVYTPDCPLPVAHSTRARASQNSATGALAAAATRATLTLRYIRLLRELGAASDHEASRALGVALASINSTRNQLGDRVIAAPAEQDERHTWPSNRVTHRTRWRLANPLQEPA